MRYSDAMYMPFFLIQHIYNRYIELVMIQFFLKLDFSFIFATRFWYDIGGGNEMMVWLVLLDDMVTEER
jgi:hypothetical protein